MPDVVVVTQKKSSFPWNTMSPPAAHASMAMIRPIGEAKPRISRSGVIIVAAVTMAIVAEPTHVRKMKPMINGARIPSVSPEKESVMMACREEAFNTPENAPPAPTISTICPAVLRASASTPSNPHAVPYR